MPSDRSEQTSNRDQRVTDQGTSVEVPTDAGSDAINDGAILSPSQEPVEQHPEGTDTTMTTHGEQPRSVALRTLPPFVKNGNRSIKVKALLHEASTKTYFNVHVAAELGL